MLARSLASLVAALAVAATAAPAAFAGTADVTPTITGAGKITGTGDPEVVGCSQAPPVSSATAKACPSWKVSKASSVSVVLYASAAPGWELSGWTGCVADMSPYCEVTAPAGDAVKTWEPVAHFVDRKPPAVTDLRATPLAGNEGYFTVDWGASEPGATFKCSLDGGSWANCRPGMRMHLDENAHRLSVYGTDPSQNAGATAMVDMSVVDTELTVAPPQGAHRRSVEFEARSRTADRFECSLDGAPFDICALGSRGLSAPLSLPDLTEGEHTLRVRGKSGDTVDLFPAARTFAIDTVAPQTTIRATDGGFTLGSDETGVTYRCRIDARPYEPCDATVTLAPGAHEVEAFATDRAGNADPSPAALQWTLAAPPARAIDAAPGDTVVPAAPAAPATATTPATTSAPAVLPAIAPAPASLKVGYRYRKGRLTRLTVTGVPSATKLVVTVKCPRGKHCPKSPATVRKLVGKRLPKGTRLTFTAGAAKRTIRL
jgi:hypothetical protein